MAFTHSYSRAASSMMPSNASFLTYVSTLGLLFLVFWVFLRLSRGSLRGVPGPLLAKLTGFQIAIASLQGRRAYKLLELHNQYGPVVRIGPNEVSISKWKYYRAIYANSKTNFKDPGFYSAANFVGLDNIFSMVHVGQHAARRKLGAAPYSLQSMTALELLVRELADRLVERLISGSESSPSGVVDALQNCGLFSFEVVCKSGFAKDFTNSKDDDSLAMLHAMDNSAMTLLFDSAMPWLRNSGFATKVPGQIGESYASREYWERKSRAVVDDFLTNTTETDKYFLTPYIKGTDGFLDRSLTKEEIVEESMGLMFAGSGTTSTTLTYLLYSLSQPKNYHLQQHLRKELQSSADDMNTIRNLPYLNAVIKETFRLYPTIISTLPRVLGEPLEVESLVLPPGTVVGMQNFVHHRDPSIFPDPNDFLPDRWLKSTNDMESALTPFSLGRRNCIGQNLAWLELYLAVASIVKGADLKLAKEMREEDMEMLDRFNIAPRGKKLLLEVKRL